MDSRAVVEQVVKQLGMLAPDGTLQGVDSLTVIDLVLKLETAIGVPVPPSFLAVEHFRTLDSLLEMLKAVEKLGR